MGSNERIRSFIMTRAKKRIIIFCAVVGLSIPAAAFADIVFDPTNFAEAVLQVADDAEMVQHLYEQVNNEVAMVKSWNFTQLPGLLQNMNVWQQVFGQGTTYSSTDPGTTLNSQYPSDPGSYAGTSDTDIAAKRAGWDQEERNILIENRTVQNDTYQNLQPTAQRIQAYVEHSNSASGATSAMQAGNEELATLVAQLQTMQAQEITDARGETERAARQQAEDAYGEQQRLAVRGGWTNPASPSTTVVDAFSLADQ
jgi:P-type conjugative transfer protein TrbJ